MKVLIPKDNNPNNSKVDIPYTFYCPVCISLLETTLGDYFEDEDNGGFYIVCPICGSKLYKQ